MDRSKSLIITAVLGLLIIFLVFSLIREIQEPISFEKAFNERKDATIKRIELIKQCQMLHRETHGKFTSTFDSLIHSVKNDSVPIVSAIAVKKRDQAKLASLGAWADKKEENPNDSSEYLIKVVSLVPIRDSLFKNNPKRIDEMRYIPFSDSEEFSMRAKMLSVQQGRYKVPVMEISAPVKVYLKGLSKKYTADKKDLVLGSISEPKLTGNWK